MSETQKNPFIGYEYKEILVSCESASMYVDCYKNFGWELDDNFLISDRASTVTIRMKRDRKLVNKMELTRLQRQFEACTREIQELDRSRSTSATIWALAVGILGTAFMAGSVFAVTHEPPVYWLCVLLAVPAFLFWAWPYFLYRRLVIARTQKIQPLIEEKQEEIYSVCEKAHALL